MKRSEEKGLRLPAALAVVALALGGSVALEACHKKPGPQCDGTAGIGGSTPQGTDGGGPSDPNQGCPCCS